MGGKISSEYMKIYDRARMTSKVSKNKSRIIAMTLPELEMHRRQQAAYRTKWRMRRVIVDISGKRPPKKLGHGEIYDLMRTVIVENREKAADLFSDGIPDAGNTEWKFGMDTLRQNQLVRNILNGDCYQLRYAEKAEDFEKFFRSGLDRTILFDSYRKFVVWQFGTVSKNPFYEVSK